MIIIGIDPGLEGALTAMDQNGEILECIDMPVIQIGERVSKKKNKDGVKIKTPINVVSGVGIYSFFYKWKPDDAYLEKVHSMPKQGVASSFTFGDTYGVARGAAEVYLGRLPKAVTPSAWKEAAGLIALDKDASRRLALRMWPYTEAQLKFKYNVDRADSMLIARYGLIVSSQ